MKERTIGRRVGFEGKLLKVEILDVELEPGVRALREVVRHPGAVVVLAELPSGEFVFVRQFRKAVERELLEAVAGTLGRGEDPEDCARRELEEETGYRATSVTRLGTIVPAPGYTDEWLHLFHARAGTQRVVGTPDADERIEHVLMSRADVERAIDDGVLVDAKSLAIWMLFCRRGNEQGRGG